MIASAARVPSGTTVQADVCVVGAGAAGIPLALSLVAHGLSVVLLDAGPQPGGMTRSWHGRCVALDPIDFERRAHVPHSGWPISWEGLQPWYARAGGWLEVGRFATPRPTADGPLVDGLDERLVIADRIERLSCPTDVGRRYEGRLRAAPELRVLTGARATSVRLQADGTRAERVTCTTEGGHRFDVAARTVVLAAGCLETTRLLLASREVFAQGIGNAWDQVGRYYQCQLRGRVGWFVPRTQRARAAWQLAPDGVPFRRRMSIAASAQRAEGLLNATLWLEGPDAGDPSHGDALLSARFLASKLAAASVPAGWRRHLANVRSGAGGLVAHLGRAAVDHLHHARRHPWSPPNPARHALWAQAEQQPNPSSRVTLSGTCDATGVPELRVDWRRGAADVASVHRTLLQLDGELHRAGAGSISLDDGAFAAGALQPVPGHHIGTARMGRDPRTSVVDVHGRVHGVHNLYVAGSAVFPTCGHADPTLTIVALALRVADHLVRRLQPRRAPALELFA